MKKEVLYFLLLLSFGLFIGADVYKLQKKIGSVPDELKNDSIFREILWKQLSNGESALYDKSFDIETYKFSKEDFECLIPYLNGVLKDEGFKNPSKEEFANKVKSLFNRTIDYGTSLKYLYINMGNPADRSPKYFRSENSIVIHPLGIFVSKEYCFITQLYAIPEILDYKNEFYNLYQKECQVSVNLTDADGSELLLYLWKDNMDIDVTNNLKTFVARNKYIFNNDSTQLDWLLEHDAVFMNLLIKNYGLRINLNKE